MKFEGLEKRIAIVEKDGEEWHAILYEIEDDQTPIHPEQEVARDTFFEMDRAQEYVREWLEGESFF